jgi:hypothetical protein
MVTSPANAADVPKKNGVERQTRHLDVTRILTENILDLNSWAQML